MAKRSVRCSASIETASSRLSPRQLLRKLVPRQVRRNLRALASALRYSCQLCLAYVSDFWRYYSNASKGVEGLLAGRHPKTELGAWIRADAHKIEKGLSLPDPRPGFGILVVERLLDTIPEYMDAYDVDQVVQWSVSVLLAYERFNTARGFEAPQISEKISALALRVNKAGTESCEGGVTSLDKEAVLKKAAIDIEEFFSSRHSIRDFSPQPIEPALVKNAVRLAQKTPSVCNRQSWKVYAFLDAQERAAVFQCQQGNRGFGESATGVLIVTVDLTTFFSYEERHQPWIDGGMFSMSLVYALHSMGLGTCCLNWCTKRKWDKKLRAITGIPEREVIVVLIAIGHLPEKLNVPHSPRKPLDDVLVI